MKTEWIQGKRTVQEALSSDRPIEKIYLAEGLQKQTVQPILKKAAEKNIPYAWTPRQKINQLATEGNHQGIVALVAAYDYASLDDCFALANKRGEQPFFILLDGIEDPHNLGSILRTADATGVHGVIIPKKRAVGLTSAVAKTSVGAIEYVPVVRVTNLKRTAEELKEGGLWIVGSDQEATQQYDRVDYQIPLALVIGNEGRGLSSLMRKKCDLLTRLPMKGKVSSLNASVAAGLLMYEVVRDRCQKR